MEKVDELKSKFLDLFQGNSKIPVIGDLAVPSDIESDGQTANETETPRQTERPSDQEILETVEPKYSTGDGSFDAGRYELGKFVGAAPIGEIEEFLFRLKRQQSVVSNKVLQMILEKQSACNVEFKNVCDVEKRIEDAVSNVNECRQKLEVAMRHFTTTSLGILANYRRRTVAQQLLMYLKTIKTLYETEFQMPELLGSGKFSKAVNLLLECRQVAGKYKQFTCVVALDKKLEDTLEMAKEHLDRELSRMCVEFDDDAYRELQTAYGLLGSTDVAVDQLHMHFVSAVHNESTLVVAGYAIVEASSSNDERSYASSCKDVSGEHFIPCLLSLCKALWKIILSHHRVVAWHEKNPPENFGGDFEAHYNDGSVKKKLNDHLSKVWKEVQNKVSSLVLAANLSNYKIDDFLEVLSILHRFSLIGNEFCGSESKEVANSVRTQSICYFKKFHADKLDDLKVFLENESWTPCPVRADFTCWHLQEFRGLRSSVELCAGVVSSCNNSVDGSSTGADFFSRFPDPKGATPFDVSFRQDVNEESITSRHDEDFSEDSDGDCDKHSKETSARRLLLTNTTLSVLRLCGKYLQMSRLLRSISVEVVSSLTQLFEYFLYTVHAFFASDVPKTLCPNASSLKLVSVIKRIKETLFENDAHNLDVNVDEALVSPMVDLRTPATLYGLKERIVAVESLIFLAKQFELIKCYLEQLLDSQGSSINYLQQFYSQTVTVAFEMRRPVYACVAWRSIDCKQVLSMMSKVDWGGVDSVSSKHSTYVDFIFEQVDNFRAIVAAVDESIHIPEPAAAELWGALFELVSRLFVEGFASAKKCSNPGKGLMLLDVKQCALQMDRISPVKSTPYNDYAVKYIQAFYLSDSDLETWIREHNEYSTKHLLGLVNCVCYSKKSRQKLIEEIEKKDNR